MIPVTLSDPFPVNVVSGGIGSNASVGLTGSTAPTSATEIGWVDGSGNLTSVSAANPLPITGSISASNPSVSSTGAAVPASGTYVGMNVSGNLTGLTGTANGLKVDGSAVTQPVSAASLPFRQVRRLQPFSLRLIRLLVHRFKPVGLLVTRLLGRLSLVRGTSRIYRGQSRSRQVLPLLPNNLL